MKRENKIQRPIRLTPEMDKRITDFLETPMGRQFSYADVIRMAIDLGLLVLECKNYHHAIIDGMTEDDVKARVKEMFAG